MLRFGTESFEPYLSRIRSLSVAAVQQIASSVPAEWIAGEEDDFCRLIERIMGRAARIDHYLFDCWPPGLAVGSEESTCQR